MYYLRAAWLILFFGKKNNFHGFRKQTLEKYLLSLKWEKATPQKKVVGEWYCCYTIPCLWDKIEKKKSLLSWLWKNNETRRKYICITEHNSSHLKACCIYACSGRGIRHFLWETWGLRRLKVNTLTYGQARRAPDWPPSAYIAQVKIWQFFVFKVLGVWGYGKLKAVTKEFHQDPILVIFGVNVVSEVIVPWSSYLVHLLPAYSW